MAAAGVEEAEEAAGRRRRCSRLAEVVGQATQDAVRPDRAVESTTGDIDQTDVPRVEEAILQRRIDMAGDRSTDTRKTLPREDRVGIVQEVAARVQSIAGLDASDADAAADKALNAVVFTEVEQAVDHEAEHRSPATGIVIGACGKVRNPPTRQVCRRGHARAIGVNRRALVADFRFNAEGAEVVANDAVDVIAIFRINRRSVAYRADIEVNVFHDHRATFDAHVPRIIACEGWCGESSGGKRHSDGKLPHKNPLSSLSLGQRKLPYPKVGFHASAQILHAVALTQHKRVISCISIKIIRHPMRLEPGAEYLQKAFDRPSGSVRVEGA